MNADQMKAAVARYWRYDRQAPLVALEANSNLTSWTDERADVLVVTEQRRLIETEVKLSIRDLRRDKKKNKHDIFHRMFFYKQLWPSHPTWHFYFAVPYELANQVCLVCDQLYPYAGVLGVHADAVVSYRDPKALANSKLPWRHIRNMVRAQSATVCRLSEQLAQLEATAKGGKGESDKGIL